MNFKLIFKFTLYHLSGVKLITSAPSPALWRSLLRVWAWPRARCTTRTWPSGVRPAESGLGAGLPLPWHRSKPAPPALPRLSGPGLCRSLHAGVARPSPPGARCKHTKKQTPGPSGRRRRSLFSVAPCRDHAAPGTAKRGCASDLAALSLLSGRNNLTQVIKQEDFSVATKEEKGPLRRRHSHCSGAGTSQAAEGKVVPSSGDRKGKGLEGGNELEFQDGRSQRRSSRGCGAGRGVPHRATAAGAREPGLRAGKFSRLKFLSLKMNSSCCHLCDQWVSGIVAQPVP
ncbi:PREDICTED: uncharacterized protein LOC105581299 [Cercocebus atys]|uniref:uncharacterized protein LOC105581299 n=1 Tax=Cercocebus atys TaxID=9531 RepID=UPI0005F46689|nr:PREDICTED: uncharacterized protein LOC105581299 [Cercocebus atys]